MRYNNGKLHITKLERLIHYYQRSRIGNNVITAKLRQNKINNTDFTIISNNCWGGICYEYFGLMKLTPTVGTYFFSKDYIKFVNNLEYYLCKELIFIDYKESKHREILEQRGHTHVPIGILEDIEIIFLHYNCKEEARDKWNRRVKRVNYDNLIIKYSNQNLPSYEDISEFSKLKNVKKVFLLSNFIEEFPEAVYYRDFKDAPELINDTYIWNKNIDIFSIINNEV